MVLLIQIFIYIVIWTKGISSASHSSWYTETQLWILLHFHTDLKHTHTLSLAIYAQSFTVNYTMIPHLSWNHNRSLFFELAYELHETQVNNVQVKSDSYIWQLGLTFWEIWLYSKSKTGISKAH